MVETQVPRRENIRPLLNRLVQASIGDPATHYNWFADRPSFRRSAGRTSAEVYAIANRLAAGAGCAVMGRLSPRTRNAQVALYQEKEVDFLVATDAIGMGLNMAVDHVASPAWASSTGPSA